LKCIKSSLGDFDEVKILPLADLHLGDVNCDFRQIQSWLSYIKENENVFTILDGDLMDSAIIGSIGSVYTAEIPPMSQLEQCVKLFEPIRDKTLAVLPGNHEYRIFRSTGIDTTALMCDQLGISDRYSNTSALLFLRFGKDHAAGRHGREVQYTVFCLHGNGGGRKEGAKLQRLVDLSSIVDADIYLSGHTHLPVVAKTSYFRVSVTNNSVSKVPKLFVNCCAALEHGGYGDRMGFKPASTDMPVICLNGRKKQATASL